MKKIYLITLCATYTAIGFGATLSHLKKDIGAFSKQVTAKKISRQQANKQSQKLTRDLQQFERESGKKYIQMRKTLFRTRNRISTLPNEIDTRPLPPQPPILAPQPNVAPVMQNLSNKINAFVDPQEDVIDESLEDLLDELDADDAQEALQNLKTLEQGIEKRFKQLSGHARTIFHNVAENANSPKLKRMINQMGNDDFLSWKKIEPLNQEITNMLFRAKDTIYTMQQDVILYYGPLLSQFKTIVDQKNELTRMMSADISPEQKLKGIETLLAEIPSQLPNKPQVDERTLLPKLRKMELK